MTTTLKSLSAGFAVTVVLALVQAVLPYLFRPNNMPNALWFLRDLFTLPFYLTLFLAEPAYCGLANYGLVNDTSFCVAGPTPVSAMVAAPTWFENIFIVLGLIATILTYRLIAAAVIKLYSLHKIKRQAA